MEIEKLIEKLRDSGWRNPGLTDKQSLEWDAATALEHLQWAWDDYRCEHDISDIVTDWMPLPAAPKEENKDD